MAKIKFDNSADGWIKYLAKNKAKIVRNPFSESGYAIRRPPGVPSWDRHLLGKKTRDKVVKLLLETYGDIATINRLIEQGMR